VRQLSPHLISSHLISSHPSPAQPTLGKQRKGAPGL
jgi:hypothetical protein